MRKVPMRKENNPVIIEKDGKKYKQIELRSALPIWAAAGVWLIAALILPMHNILHLAGIGLVSLGAAFLVKKILPKETKLVEIPVNTGNRDLDETVTQINEASAALNGVAQRIAAAKPETARRLENIVKTVGKIRDALVESPADLSKVRRFLNYYLPTTQKLADKYATLTAQETDSQNIRETALSIEGALAQVDDSFIRQLDALFADDALDVSTDISVLETLLARDNLK